MPRAANLTNCALLCGGYGLFANRNNKLIKNVAKITATIASTALLLTLLALSSKETKGFTLALFLVQLSCFKSESAHPRTRPLISRVG